MHQTSAQPSLARRRRSRLSLRLVLLALTVAAFLPFLGRRDIVTSHEARVVQVARQMAASGPPWRAAPVQVPAVEIVHIEGRTESRPRADGSTWRVNPWLIPILNGQIRLQKPPLPYWTVATLLRLFDRAFSIEFLARVPSALMGAFATLILFDLARRLFNNLTAWCAALVWVSSYFIPDEYRKVMADPYLAFFTLAAIWSWIRWTADRSWRWSLCFYVSVALGILAKGVIFPHLAIALAAYHFCYRRRLPGTILQHIAGIVLLALIALPWFACIFHQIPDAWNVMRYESIGELSDNTEKARRWWFYFPNLLQIALPWTPILIVGAFLPLLRPARVRRAGRAGGRTDRRRLFPIIWYGVTVLFFSFVNIKKNAYLLPAMPAQTLLIAQGLTFLFVAIRRHRSTGLAPLMLIIERGMAAAFALAVIFACLTINRRGALMAGILTAILAIACLHFSSARYFTRPRTWILSISAAFVIAALGFFNFYVTPRENLRSARPVAAELTPLLAQSGTKLLSDNLPEEASIYLPLTPADPTAERVLMIIDDRRPDPASPPRIPQQVHSRTVTLSRRLPLSSAPGDRARWKVYELITSAPP